MDKGMSKTTIRIIIGLIISLIVVPIVVVSILNSVSNTNSQQLTNNPPERSNDEVAAAIAKSNSYLHDSKGKPTFKLLKVKRLANNWYMAWIDSATTKVLINDPSLSANNMRVLLGPAATFDVSDTYSKGIPQQVFGDFVNAKMD
jgi:hypothetical protein